MSKGPREYNELLAIEGDLYWFHDGRLLFVSNAIEVREKLSLFKRIKLFIRRKRYDVVTLDRRTLEYIYNVCHGVMPRGKEEFVRCVMSTIPDNQYLLNKEIGKHNLTKKRKWRK